ARVYKIAPDGKASVIFAPEELQVQALAIDSNGAIYAATSPDGKVYKIVRGGSAPAKAPEPAQDGGKPSQSGEKARPAVAGDPAEIFRVEPNGTGAVFFKSDEAQIRVLDFDKSGNLIAGTDGSGLIYRISPQGEGFVLYSAPKKEITALAIDQQGNIYAAGAGDKRTGSPIPQPGASGGPATGGSAPVIVVQQGSAQATGSAP